jgi:hypothetical protein
LAVGLAQQDIVLVEYPSVLGNARLIPNCRVCRPCRAMTTFSDPQSNNPRQYQETTYHELQILGQSKSDDRHHAVQLIVIIVNTEQEAKQSVNDLRI